MCGIYGILDLGGRTRRDQDVLDAMGDQIRHRGPDDSGKFSDGPVLLGMRRLSVIDVAGGHQPIHSEDGQVTAVCNGEIYNFRQLRAELQGRGHHFRSNSDSEVTVHAYEEFGIDFLSRLEGMFAVAVWDRVRHRLIVARDPLGIKPLYFRRVPTELAFSSEAKAILALPDVGANLDLVSLEQYLAVGYVPAPNSMFAGISKLEPGTAIIVDRGAIRLHRFHEFSCAIDSSRSQEDWAEEIRTEVERAVRAQMVSDVPIGAFLSGGIDSSAVVAFMSRYATGPVRTYSIGFEGSTGAQLYNELPYARKVASTFETEHQEILVKPDVARLLPSLLWHMDEPVADSAFVTTYLVSKFARRDVTVILSGVGGDELFAGYTRYLDGYYRAAYRRLPAVLRNGLIRPIAAMLPSDRHSPLLNKLRLAKAFIEADGLPFESRYRAFMQVFDQEARTQMLRGRQADSSDSIARAFKSTKSNDPINRLMEVDLATQLPDCLLLLTDKMSMAVSLECRVPLLDQRLVALAHNIPGAMKLQNGSLKHLLKQALAPVLPGEILNRQKRGFGAPMGAWLRTELAPLLANFLSKDAIARRGLFDADTVHRTVREHASQRADRTDHLLGLLNFEIWCRMFLDGRSPSDVTAEVEETRAA